MKKRGIGAIIGLTIITFGIYSLYLFVSTKNEMNNRGAKIPTAWLIIVPLVSIWWLWKYSEAAEETTNKEANGILTFILLFLLGFIGQIILQTYFNKVGDQTSATAAGFAPGPQPVSSINAVPTTPNTTTPANAAYSTPPTQEVSPPTNPNPPVIQ